MNKYYVVRIMSDGSRSRSMYAHEKNIAEELASRADARDAQARYVVEPEATCTAQPKPLPMLEAQHAAR